MTAIQKERYDRFLFQADPRVLILSNPPKSANQDLKRFKAV